MTARKGTDSFTTSESFISEEKHISLVDEIFNEFKSIDDKWEIKKGVSTEDLIGKENVVNAIRMDGKSTEILSDGGIIYYDGKIVGVCENKYQKITEMLAKERVNIRCFSTLNLVKCFYHVVGKDIHLIQIDGVVVQQVQCMI